MRVRRRRSPQGRSSHRCGRGTWRPRGRPTVGRRTRRFAVCVGARRVAPLFCRPIAASTSASTGLDQLGDLGFRSPSSSIAPAWSTCAPSSIVVSSSDPYPRPRFFESAADLSQQASFAATSNPSLLPIRRVRHSTRAPTLPRSCHDSVSSEPSARGALQLRSLRATPVTTQRVQHEHARGPAVTH